MYDLVYWWFEWGAVACMLSSVFVAALVVSHAVSRRVRNVAGVVAALLAPFLVLPSLVLKAQLDLPSVAGLRLSESRHLAATLLAIGSTGWIAGGVGAIGHFVMASVPPVGHPHSRGLQPWLELWDPARHWCYPIDDGQMTVGRDYHNQVIIGHADVSRAHALIERQGDYLFLSDLGSRYGTYLNNQRVTGTVALHALDVLRFGSTATARVLMLAG